MARFEVRCATCEGAIDFLEDGLTPCCAGCRHSGDTCACEVAPELEWLSGALLVVRGSVEAGQYRPRGVWVQEARRILTWLVGHGWQLIHLGERHIVDVTDRSYGLQHPAACRPNLIDCEFNRWLAAQDNPPQSPGRYFMDLSRHDFAASFEPVAPSELGGTDG